jgi:hypothetical protein
MQLRQSVHSPAKIEPEGRREGSSLDTLKPISMMRRPRMGPVADRQAMAQTQVRFNTRQGKKK